MFYLSTLKCDTEKKTLHQWFSPRVFLNFEIKMFVLWVKLDISKADLKQ